MEETVLSYPLNPILAEVYRGDLIESVHRGSVAVTQGGKLCYHIGDVERLTYLRSAAKPVQTLPVILSGAADAFGFDDEELACMSGSHNGEEVHVAVVRRILHKAGLDETELLCGSMEPLDRETRITLDCRGALYSPIYNNCSGKHAGLLALAVFLKADRNTYWDSGHPVQEMIRATLAELADENRESIMAASDGCSARVYAVPLWKIAIVYERLAHPQHIANRELANAVVRLRRAVVAHPYMIAGRNRICTDLLTTCMGRVLCKSGAEGVYALGLVDRGIGFAVKIDDGSSRGYLPLVLYFLEQQGILSDDARNHLQAYRCIPVRNHRGQVVGRVAKTGGISFPHLVAGKNGR